MQKFIRPNPGGLGEPRGARVPRSKRMTGCGVARFIGLIALAAVASSCLPVGSASTSTDAVLTVGDRIESSPARDASGAFGIGLAPSEFDRDDIREALAIVNTAPSANAGAIATPTPSAEPEHVWVVADDEQAATLAALGHQVGNTVIVATGDLRALPPQTRELIVNASTVELSPGLNEDTLWQLEVIRRGREIPGGGLLMFDEDLDRRLVAIYGHPSGPGLGVLGEQSPEDGVERLRSIAEGYDADGAVVLPTFEIITTVASAGPGGDGDYSSMTARDVIRPWVETAAANNVYVVLDLQPGRSNFLSQAKVYEEFLRLPHVGLAIDPEWRLKPHQVHLEQIGTVDAAEVNQVVRWLAGIVREEALPQKLLVLHQFSFSMITNRELVETPPELAVLIHMDGQGTMNMKHNTWNSLTGERDASQFHWGWKNFYDEDSPMATPRQVLELTPNPVFVSFQ